MKIENKDIIYAAQQLRDEQNAQLHVRPWNRHRHFHVPAWLVAVPAAAIIGFVLGIWTNSSNTQHAPLTALVDTVYIKVPEKAVESDTIVQTVAKQQEATTISPSSIPAKVEQRITTGRSIADDHIRYDLLVKN